jgi:hypothetical protein
MAATVLRLWTRGFPDPEQDRFGKDEPTKATVSVEPADEYFGPMVLVATHDQEMIKKHVYVVQFNEPEELDDFIARLRSAREAWKHEDG